MRLIFYGTLRDRFGEYVDMQSDTVADAIEGFSRQVAWPTDLRVQVVEDDGLVLDTVDKLRTHYDAVHILPALTGGSGKFTNIILGAVLIGAAFIPGIGTAVMTTLLISGGLMALQGVIGLFMKSPKVTSVNDPEASKYLPVNKNTTEVGTPITMAWGRIDVAGQWISLNSSSNNLAYGVFPA